MSTQHVFDMQEEKNWPSSLDQLGWQPFFQNQLRDKLPDQLPGKVVGVRKNTFLVKQGEQDLAVPLVGKFFQSFQTELPVVGDWVLLHNGVITTLLRRKNTLLRQASGTRNRKKQRQSTGAREQVIAANLDMVFIVCGLDRDFNLRRIERYLTLVYNCGLSPVIILTKSDLCPNPDSILSDVQAIAYGVPVYLISWHEDRLMREIAGQLTPNRSAALLGSSGAGKSTLINKMVGKEVRTTGKLGARVGKGKHTTTSRDLILLPSGGMVIDNPGIREIGLVHDGVGGGSMDTFPEIDNIAQLCKFADCTHSHEPGCRVLQAVQDKEIPAARLASYHKLKSEAFHIQQCQTKSASRIEKEKWREVSRKAKSIKKQRLHLPE